MNTIPSIFNENLPSYTAVGGEQQIDVSNVTAVILSREDRYPHRRNLEELSKEGFDRIISIELPGSQISIDEMRVKYPNVRFIFLKENVTAGEQINLAVSEITSPLFLCLWNDLKLFQSGGALRIAERLYSPRAGAAGEGGFKRLCTVPLLKNADFEDIPTCTLPATQKAVVKTIQVNAKNEGHPVLYPVDYIGIYDKKRFIGLGGFDTTIKNEHWQLMDFGFRSKLWGEEIAATLLLRLSYFGNTPIDDVSIDDSYRRFYLKNIAPVFHGDNANLPYRRFLPYLFTSGADIFKAFSEFKAARAWVKTNRFRFKTDAKTVIALWEYEFTDTASQA
ncbi:MAG: hypothetical protein LBM77_11200 [Spirochaetaceae bacterium]|nr:hypothetical protein [Spirochaetaceae bacterium]